LTTQATARASFEQVKQAREFRHFLLRGFEKVQAEWAIVCTAYSILKLHQQCGVCLQRCWQQGSSQRAETKMSRLYHNTINAVLNIAHRDYLDRLLGWAMSATAIDGRQAWPRGWLCRPPRKLTFKINLISASVLNGAHPAFWVLNSGVPCRDKS
jgi:hypothetical protein